MSCELPLPAEVYMNLKQRILYVEDHEDTSELISLILQQHNYEVVLDCTVEAALRTARAQHFDLYLLDTRLPDGSGVDLCKEIRKFDLTPLAAPLGPRDLSKFLRISAGERLSPRM